MVSVMMVAMELPMFKMLSLVKSAGLDAG